MSDTPARQTAPRTGTPAARAVQTLAAAIGSARRPRLGTACRATLAALVFFAVLPSVLPYDHLLPGADTGASEAAEAMHASHCHASPATCSDAPVTSGPGKLLFGAPIVVVPAMLAVLLLLTVAPLTGITRRPEIRPPVAATR